VDVFPPGGGTAIEIPLFIADGNTRLLEGGGKYGSIFESNEYGVEFSQYEVIDGATKRPIDYV
jgi:hypothetical protein